jgi:hypothetical protein
MQPQVSVPADLRRRTLFCLSNHELWDFWPFMPVVRRKPGCEEEMGVVYDALHARSLPGYTCTVFLTNVFQLPETIEELIQLPHETFDTFDELANAGWTVD